MSVRNLYLTLSTSPGWVAVPCVCRLVSKQSISWQNATTDVHFVFEGPQYNSSGVLLNCITVPQQWRAVHLNHNTTTAACCQIVAQYHSNGVLFIWIKIPQQWRAVKLHHNTTTVVCSQFRSHYRNKVSNLLKFYYKTESFITYPWFIFRRKKKKIFIHCSQIFEGALFFGVSCTVTGVPSANI